MHTVAGEAQAIDFQSPWSLLKYTRALTTGELALMPTIKMQVREDTGPGRVSLERTCLAFILHFHLSF